MKNRNIVIVGGDKRQNYLKKYLLSKNFSVESYGLFDWDDDSDKLKTLIKPESVVILPLPASRNNKTINMPFSKKEVTIERLVSFLSGDNVVMGGMIKGELLCALQKNNIPFVDFYDSDFIEKNAFLTSFGLVKILLEHVDFVLPAGEYAVMGYGRVAKETSRILKSLSCNVTIFARNPLQRQDAEMKGHKAYKISEFYSVADKFDIVINTVPSCVIDNESLKNMKKGSKIIELASAPYGVNSDEAQKNGVDVIKAPGLPGKYTPKTAGELIGKKAEEFLQRERNI